MRVKSLESRVESQKPSGRAALALWLSTLDSRLSTLPPRPDPHRAAGRDHHPHDDRGGGDSDHRAVERRPPAPRGQPRRSTRSSPAPRRGRSRCSRPFGVALKRLSQTRDTDRQRRRRQRRVPRSVLRRAAAALRRLRRQLAGLRRALHPNSSLGSVLVRFVTRGTPTESRTACRSAGMPICFPTGMIRPGDVIEIDGTRFELLHDPATTSIDADRTRRSNGYFIRRRTSGNRADRSWPGRSTTAASRSIRSTTTTGARSAPAGRRRSRPIGPAPRRTKSSASRRRPPTSRTSCPKARRSTCGPPAWAATITFTCRTMNDNSRGRADHVRAGRPRLAGVVQPAADRCPNEADDRSTSRWSTTCTCWSASARTSRRRGRAAIRRSIRADIDAATTDEKRARTRRSRSTGSAATAAGS